MFLVIISIEGNLAIDACDGLATAAGVAMLVDLILLERLIAFQRKYRIFRKATNIKIRRY
jgi:hypothetical protein